MLWSFLSWYTSQFITQLSPFIIFIFSAHTHHTTGKIFSSLSIIRIWFTIDGPRQPGRITCQP